MIAAHKNVALCVCLLHAVMENTPVAESSKPTGLFHCCPWIQKREAADESTVSLLGTSSRLQALTEPTIIEPCVLSADA